MATAEYTLVVEDRFDSPDSPDLDEALWLPHHLPQWSSMTKTPT